MYLIAGENIAQIAAAVARQPILYSTRKANYQQPLAALGTMMNLRWFKSRRVAAAACIGTTVIMIVNIHKAHLKNTK